MSARRIHRQPPTATKSPVLRWIVAAIFILAGPAYAATDLRTLLSAAMLDAEDPVLQDWAFDVEAGRDIAWEEDAAQFSKEYNAHARSGRLGLAWPGAEGTRLDGLSWQVTLLGSRWGPTQLEIDSVGNLPELPNHLPELAGLSATPRWCERGAGATFGTRVYTLEAPGKQTAFLRHEWSCGSAGCAVKLRLYVHEREVQEFVTKALGMDACEVVEEAPDPAARRLAPFVAGEVWRGEYVCAQGNTELELEITQVDGPQVTAIFHFFHAESESAGRFYVRGSYQPELRRMAFEGGEWIERPGNYGAVGLLGHLDADAGELVGVIDARGCGAFWVAR